RQLVRDLVDRAFGGAAAPLGMEALFGRRAAPPGIERIRKTLCQRRRVAAGNREHSEAPGRDRGREAMTTFDATTVEVLGWALVHFAWQGALAAGVFGVLNLALHGAAARLRYALAAFTLAAMALMPPLTVLFT